MMPPNDPRLSNRTRDHLANERTFLAWVRTALGLIGLGFVLARMGLFLAQLAVAEAVPLRGRHAGREFIVTGIVFLLLGTMLGGWSGWLYERARRGIEAGHYEPSRRSVLALTVVIVTGGLVIAALVLWRTSVAGY